MENAQRAIMIGVGLFITIIIITAVMIVINYGQNIINRGSDKIQSISAQLDMTELSSYDNTTVTGSQVIAAITKYWSDPNIVVYYNGTCYTNANCNIEGLNGERVKATGYDESGNKDTHESQSTGSVKKNIVSGAKINAHLIYQGSSDTVIGIYFGDI